jgi:hypothetical protein
MAVPSAGGGSSWQGEVCVQGQHSHHAVQEQGKTQCVCTRMCRCEQLPVGVDSHLNESWSLIKTAARANSDRWKKQRTPPNAASCHILL